MVLSKGYLCVVKKDFELELGNITNQGSRAHHARDTALVGRYREFGRSASIGVKVAF